VRTDTVPDLGTIVSVTFTPTVDTGWTSVSVPIPTVVLPDKITSVHIATRAATTIHRILAAAIGYPQGDTYITTTLRESAALGENPA
jgi:hypothetical protein